MYIEKTCLKCGFNDTDFGCLCPHYDKWYACPIDNSKPENVQALKEYVEDLKNDSMSDRNAGKR